MAKAMSRRLLLLVAALVVGLAGLLASAARGGLPLTDLPLRDFVEYWAAGKLLAAGENPYDPARIKELEEESGREEEPILMWNPPWALPFVLPLGWLPVRQAHLVWLLAHFLALLVSAELLWRSYGGDPDWRLLAVVLTFTFVPSLSALIVGQISPLLLLGAAAFLPLARGRHDLAAGAVTTLLAIKPHMAYLFWVALVVWAMAARRWRLLVGGAVTGLLLTGVALAFRPTILEEYWQTFRETPAKYASPTLGYLLRMALGSPSFGWQFVPLLPGLAWLAWHGWRHRQDWDWARQLPPLLLVSALTAAYGAWLFDLVILLVPVLAVAAWLGRAGSRGQRLAGAAVHVGVAGLGLALMLVPLEVEYLHFIWITPVLLAAWAALAPPASAFTAVDEPADGRPPA